jgi:hypothetical protein
MPALPGDLAGGTAQRSAELFAIGIRIAQLVLHFHSAMTFLHKHKAIA